MDVINYINSNEPADYEKIIRENLKDDIMLGLSNIRKNLIYSYEFQPNSTILEIGANLGEITGVLCEKADKVVSIEFDEQKAEAVAKRHNDKNNLEIKVGKLKEIELQEKFDYITLFGVIEHAQKLFDTKQPALDLIKYCMNFLKPEGKILIATNNKFALKSYVGDIDECTGITFDSITGYKSSKKTYKLGKNQIENILNEVGLIHYKFFYPLPDYKMTSLIFSDDYLPSSSKINGYFPYYNENSYVFFSEVDAYDAIIKEDRKMFPFFANSYFIEASRVEFKNDTRYVSFNNYRKEEYQLMTKIREKTVEKISINEKSREHLNRMFENISKLKEENIEIIDKEQDGKVESEFRSEKLASQLISDNYKNPEEILKILNKYKEEILKLALPYQESEETVLEKYIPDIDKEILPKFKYLKNGYWDMILKNCFIIDDKCVFFDQEWMEENVPMEFLIYRSIVNVEKIRSRIEEYQLFEKMEIKEYISIFEELDRKITEKIIDKDFFGFYVRRYRNPIYENYELKQQNEELIQQNKQLTERCEELENKKQELSTGIEEKNKVTTELKEELEDIYQSKTWKFAHTLAKIKRKLKK